MWFLRAMLGLALTVLLAQSAVEPVDASVPDAGVVEATPAPVAVPVAAEPKHEWKVELSTLELLHTRGTLSDAEFESAVKDLRDSTGLKAPDGTTLVVSKFALTMYGFIQANAIYDTTESFTEQIGNGLVAKPTTYAGTHDRFQFSARHSRFGFRLKAPEFYGVRASAVLEMDFLGTQLPVGAGQPYFGTEAAYVANPSLRARHLYLKVETPVLDFIAGQYWPVFGGQPSGNPNTVEIQGVPSQLYSRMPQVRVSKTLVFDLVNLDLIAAAVRSPQRDSGLPDGQAAVKLSFNKWLGFSTGGATASGINPASLTLSGDVRSVRLPEFTAAPTRSNEALGFGVAADLYLPIIPATKKSHAGALTFVGEIVHGRGTADLYSGLNGGVSFPALPNPDMITPAPTWSQDIDNGIAVYDTAGALHLIEWTTGLASLQYYLPVLEGRIWVSAMYSRSVSPNTKQYGGGNARKQLDYASGAVFGDVLPSVRLGLEYAVMIDHSVSDVIATNHRVNFAAYYLF